MGQARARGLVLVVELTGSAQIAGMLDGVIASPTIIFSDID